VTSARTRDNDLARDFQSEDVGRSGGWGIHALALQYIRSVHARGGDLHEDLALTGRRYRASKHHQAACSVSDHRAH
jgi:hypothetical protein